MREMTASIGKKGILLIRRENWTAKPRKKQLEKRKKETQADHFVQEEVNLSGGRYLRRTWGSGVRGARGGVKGGGVGEGRDRREGEEWARGV